MNRKAQIQAEIEWQGRQYGVCKACPRIDSCPYRNRETGVAIINQNETIIASNPENAGMLGHTEESMVGKTTMQMTAAFSWPLHQHQRQCVKQQGVAEYKKWLVAKGNVLVAVHVSVRLDYERGEPVYLAFTNPICPVLIQKEHYRPIQYPHLVVVGT